MRRNEEKGVEKRSSEKARNGIVYEVLRGEASRIEVSRTDFPAITTKGLAELKHF